MTGRFRAHRSRQAAWSRRLALFAIPLLALTALLHRSGNLETFVALIAIVLTVVLAILALFLGVSAIIAVWKHGHKGVSNALIGILVSLAVLALPARAVLLVIEKPALNDVVTNPAKPPLLTYAARNRPTDANGADYDPGNAAKQKAAYPEIKPLDLDLPAIEAFEIVRGHVDDAGWSVVLDTAPMATEPGRIEAVAATMIFGFRDDIAIEVWPMGDATSRVEMRSASRYGRHDLGANAERIFSFLRGLLKPAETAAEN